MKGKKGITLPLETIAKMILLLSVFIILGLVVQKFIWAGQGAGDYNKCKWSIYAASKAKWSGQTTVNLDCPRNEYIIKEERVVTGNTLDHELVKKEFFGEMLKCWEMAGNGELNSFDEVLLRNGGDVSGFACLICTTVEFDDKIKKEYSSTPNVPGFTDFLSTQYDATHTYYDMISRPEEMDVQIAPFSYETKEVGTPEYFEVIDITETYYIVYAAFPGVMGNNAFAFVNDKLGGILSDNKPYSKLVVITKDNLQNLNCNYGLYN